MIRFTLIGAGRIGKIHAENIARHPEATLAYVADADQNAAAELARRWSAGVVSLEEAVSRNDVDAVLIASSTDTHADWIERCAAAGKPVFCEKPLDLAMERATSCLRVAERAGIPLYLGFNRRYDPSFMRLKREIAAGTIGQLETLHIISRDPSPPPVEYIRRSGGLFRDMMIHDFDMARWLLAEEVVEVYAAGVSLVDPAIAAAGDIDTAKILLRTASGRICAISNSRRSGYGYDQRIEAFCSNGLLRVGNVHESTLESWGENGAQGSPLQNFFLDRYAQAYRAETRIEPSVLTSRPSRGAHVVKA